MAVSDIPKIETLKVAASEADAEVADRPTGTILTFCPYPFNYEEATETLEHVPIGWFNPEELKIVALLLEGKSLTLPEQKEVQRMIASLKNDFGDFEEVKNG